MLGNYLCFTGAKFWKSPKIIKAVKEEEYRKLELKRNGSAHQASTSSSSKHTITVESSSSDSDGGLPLLRRKRSHFQDTVVGGHIIGQLSVVETSAMT